MHKLFGAYSICAYLCGVVTAHQYKLHVTHITKIRQ
uniref:Uncharacterized protein n=1 Tax=Myoviridae sp. ctFNi10 TaxID=2825067 RepID=A0A8S5TX27_9CAUD|nr:MAG TPA: hypothetical protein [Myoviridae sp. ctFNi10]